MPHGANASFMCFSMLHLSYIRHLCSHYLPLKVLSYVTCMPMLYQVVPTIRPSSRILQIKV